jgi:hypothetical protein
MFKPRLLIDAEVGRQLEIHGTVGSDLPATRAEGAVGAGSQSAEIGFLLRGGGCGSGNGDETPG